MLIEKSLHYGTAMKKGTITALVTSSTVFAFFYILAFIAVVVTAVLTDGALFWVKLSWAMLSILGVFITVTAYVSFQEARQSTRWPAVSAKLLSARVKSQMGSDSGRSYSPVVEYEFSFKGKDHTGNTIDYSGQSGSQAWAEKVLNELKSKGIALTVHVNPDNPEMNVLNPGVRFVHMLRYIVGPAMFVIGLLAALDILIF